VLSKPHATVNKAIILKNTLKILNDPDRLPITIAKMRELVGVSSSSLNRIFLSEYGIPPKSYIRSRCLSAARDALARVSPEVKVSDIANRWGFWHMGQFAGDYRRMFGELPSDTLKRNY
jgi:AraC family ethanolamine operon transcriptional activator